LTTAPAGTNPRGPRTPSTCVDANAERRAGGQQRASETAIVDLALGFAERAAAHRRPKRRLREPQLVAREPARPRARAQSRFARFIVCRFDDAVELQARVDAAAFQQIRNEAGVALERRKAECPKRRGTNHLRVRREHPGAGPGGRVPRFVGIDDVHGRTAARELVADGETDQAGADDDDRRPGFALHPAALRHPRP
jgi:hypothetical protein